MLPYVLKQHWGSSKFVLERRLYKANRRRTSQSILITHWTSIAAKSWRDTEHVALDHSHKELKFKNNFVATQNFWTSSIVSRWSLRLYMQSIPNCSFLHNFDLTALNTNHTPTTSPLPTSTWPQQYFRRRLPEFHEPQLLCLHERRRIAPNFATSEFASPGTSTRRRASSHRAKPSLTSRELKHDSLRTWWFI